MKWAISDKYTELRRDLFLDREIRGLFGYRGGLVEININSDKMLKFRHRVFRHRRPVFVDFVKDEFKKGATEREEAEEAAYKRLSEYCEIHFDVLTSNRFKELYPQDNRKAISW